MSNSPLKIFSGSSHPELAQKIAQSLGQSLDEMIIKKFASCEIYAKPLQTVRGADVFIIQTTTELVNEELMELFIMIDALKRSFASHVHVVIPHLGYSRQDRVASPREPITAKLVAKLISAAGADHVITVQLHSEQAQGFFDFPVDNLSVNKLFANYFQAKNIQDLVVVAPDTGAAKSAQRFADLLGVELAIIHKVRAAHNVSEAMHVIGDVQGRTCVVIDDLIDTAGTVVNCKQALIRAGAAEDVYLMATHPIFSPPAVERLREAQFKEVIVTDTIPLALEKHFPGLQIISVAPLLAQIIANVHEGKSVSEVY